MLIWIAVDALIVGEVWCAIVSVLLTVERVKNGCANTREDQVRESEEQRHCRIDRASNYLGKLFLVTDSLEIFIKLIQNFVFGIFMLFKFVNFNWELFQFLKDLWNWSLDFLCLSVDWVNLFFNGVSFFDVRFRLSDQLLSLNDSIFHLEVAWLSF